ncbi:MAG: hypothetical protein HY043_02085 [Verrucomicrobia bacterium]|nr:hypothetical protein [Verrucomicrobiota bacterium]
MRKERLPPALCQHQVSQLVITALLAIATLAGDDDVSRNVEADPEAVHPVKVLHGGTVGFEQSLTVATLVLKCRCYGLSVTLVGHADAERSV